MDAGPGPLYINVTQNPALTNCCGLKPLFEVYDGLNVFESLIANGNINVSENGAGCTPYDILACGSPRISGFTLMNQRTQDVIQSFQDEMTIDVAYSKFSHFLLQANTAPPQVEAWSLFLTDISDVLKMVFPISLFCPRLRRVLRPLGLMFIQKTRNKV